MRIPEIRERLRILYRRHGDPELLALANELRRRPFARRADPHSRRCTPALRAEIAAFAAANPGLSQRQVADAFNVNPGRVSECVAGMRK